MNNKILVIVKVPFIEMEFEMYIPINKKIGYVKQMIISSIKERADGNLDDVSLKLFDKETCSVFNNNIYVKESSIRNGTVLFLI